MLSAAQMKRAIFKGRGSASKMRFNTLDQSLRPETVCAWRRWVKIGVQPFLSYHKNGPHSQPQEKAPGPLQRLNKWTSDPWF